MARRAASIWRAVTRSGCVALRPKEPKFRSEPPLASPLIRPLNCLRNFVRFGCSICHSSLTAAAGATRRGTILEFLGLAITRTGIVLHDLTLEDPDLDADDAIGGCRLDIGIIDIGAQRVQRHPTLAIPFGPGDFGAAKTPRDVDPDTQGPHPHGVLHGALHRTTEGHTTLKLLRDAVTHQGSIKLGLAHLDDVEMQLAVGHLRQLLAQRLDIRAFLADDDAGARGVDRDAALLVRTLDDHTADAGLLALGVDELADREILEQKITVILGVGIPAAVPGAVHLQALANRIDFVTH